MTQSLAKRLLPKNKQTLKGLSCYACSAPATSWEHAPPEGYFPAPRETWEGPKGHNYRRSLIRVPSCKDHNEAKSHEDSYVMAVVGYLAKSLAQSFRGTTLHPFADKIIRRAQSHEWLRDHLETLPDGRRAITVIPGFVAKMVEFVARALYYHEHDYDRRWQGGCTVFESHILPVFPSPSLPGVNAAAYLASGFDELRRRGEAGYTLMGAHPDIFAYQLYEASLGPVVMEMRFYGTLTFYAMGDRPEPPPAPGATRCQ